VPTGERIAKNEAVFREVNERIRELSERLRADAPTDLVSFVCECSAVECHRSVELTLLEYEDVRAEPNRFLVAFDHVWEPEFEREVLRTERYAVLEKLGEAADAAAALDPRT
jgi:hypothetical protein